MREVGGKFAVSMAIVVGTVLGGNISAAKAQAWQPLHADGEGTTYVDVGSVIHTSGGQNRVTKVVKNLLRPDDSGVRSILWHVEFDCEDKKRYRLTSTPFVYQGEMATGSYYASDHNDFGWKPIFEPFNGAMYFACAMAP